MSKITILPNHKLIILRYLCKYGNINYIKTHISTLKNDIMKYIKINKVENIIIEILLKYNFIDYALELMNEKCFTTYNDYCVYNSIYEYCSLERIKNISEIYPQLKELHNDNDCLVFAYKNNIEIVMWMKENCNIDMMIKIKTITILLYNEQLEKAKIIYNIFPINITYNNYFIIKFTTKTHNMRIMKWLCTLYDPYSSYKTLYYACKYNFLKFAKYLVYRCKYYDLTDKNHIFIRVAQNNNSTDIIKWLERIYPKYISIIYNDVKYSYICEEEIKVNEECVICYDKACIVTKCGHYYCPICHARIKKTCFYCRQIIDKKIIKIEK